MPTDTDTLTRRASNLCSDADKLISSPAALLLPVQARLLIRELARLIRDIAVECEK